MLDSIVKVITGKVKLRGNTDGTLIGNSGDALKVTGSFTSVEPATFIARSEDIAIGNNKSMLSLLNASGSSVIIKLREIVIVSNQTATVSGIVTTLELRPFTSHSGGTAITILSYDTNDSSNGSVTAKTGSTISGEGSLYHRWKLSTDEWGTGTPDVESGDHSISLYDGAVYRHKPQITKPITMRAGQGFHIKNTLNSTIGNLDIWYVFTEE